MKKEIEVILEELENSSTSSGLAVADHIRTVASNGPEYRTPEAIAEEASALVQWAMKLDTALLDAVRDAKAALVGNSNDAEHDALFSLIQALGYEKPECLADAGGICVADANGGQDHSKECPCRAWEKKP